MREILGLILIIIFVWLTMLTGLVVIFASLPILIITLSERIGRFLESIVVAGIATAMVLIWLLL